MFKIYNRINYIKHNDISLLLFKRRKNNNFNVK